MDRPVTKVAIVAVRPLFRWISDKTVWSFVQVEADDGTLGWGEATIAGEAGAIGAEVLRQHGALAGEVVDVADGIVPLAAGMLGWAVACGIDQAVWDIVARRAGCGLAGVLGAEPRADVPVYANINRGTLDRAPAGFARAAAAAVAAGFTSIKIAPFDGMAPGLAGMAEGARLTQLGLDRIAAAMQAMDGAAELMVDCHWRFTPESAETALREAARIGICWFECPLPETAANIAEVRRLRGIANGMGVRLAGMEEASTLAAFLPWVEAYDVMMPDVKYAGGLAETLRIAAALRARGVAVSLHNPSGTVCHAVSLHMSAVLPGAPVLEMQWAETEWLFDLASPALPRPAGGRSAVPAGPGHGAGLPLDALVAAPP